MATQLNFLTEFNLIETAPVGFFKKRVRKEIPTYKKVYSVYQYDREKYMSIWAKIRKLALKFDNPTIFFNVNPYSVLRHCYIKDYGELQHLGDEKHIFRMPVLKAIQKELYTYSSQPLQKIFLAKELSWEQHGIIFYYDFKDGGEGEIKGTQLLSIKERLKAHIKLLRYLRKGYNLQKAMRLCL